MRLVDTHVHIYLDAFAADRDAVLDRARNAGVRAFLLPAIDVASVHAALDLAARNDDIWVMAALHPSETKTAGEAEFREIEELSREDRIVAVGETGLDHYWDRTFDERQEDMLRRHIGLAAERDLPLVFHTRDSLDDVVRVVHEERDRIDRPDRIRGVFHCFGGSARQAESVLALGFHLGIGGSLTFRNGGVPAGIAGVPLDRVVLETDAPFLAPVPFRGKRNEPAHVAIVARFLAELRGIDADSVADATTRSAEAVFGVRFPP